MVPNSLHRTVQVGAFLAVESRLSGYALPPAPDAVLIKLDWATQLQKVNHVPLSYEKTPELSLALVAAGSAVGKVAGGGAAVAASKVSERASLTEAGSVRA